MVTEKLKKFLDQNGIVYTTIYHTLAYTAQTTAESAHIPGKEVAKAVVVKLEGKPAMAVLPASLHLSMDALRRCVGCDEVTLANEKELRSLFPGCEVGAMPPFGNLFGLDVYVDEALAEDEVIAFNAGSHTELIRMKYADYERLVEPKVVAVARR